MARFTQLILTRFNLSWNQPGVDDAWLEHRIGLFERFCLPSVRAQTERRFRWLVFIDANTPARFEERIRRHESWETLRVYSIHETGEQQISRAVDENVASDATHLISSSLDNDDALATTYVERVREEFEGQPFEIINFSSGLRLDIRSGKLYSCTIPFNPFVTLIELIEPGGRHGVSRCLPHSEIPERFDQIRDVAAEPLWLQILHERNLAPTGVWGRRREPVSLLHGRFNIDYALPDRESRPAIAGERLFRGIQRQLSRPFTRRQRRRVREWFAGDGRAARPGADSRP